MTFFTNFPLVNYTFGNENSQSVFQNLTTYIDIIDQLTDQVAVYTEVTIPNGERPDILSQTLYGTTDYYWQFYMLNEKLRVQGWPFTPSEVTEYLKVYYPNTTLKTNSNLQGEFYVGDLVAKKDDNGTFDNPPFKAKILKKNLDLGHLIVKPIVEVASITITNPGSGYTAVPTITFKGGNGEGASAVPELNEAGQVSGVTVINGGDDYKTAPTIEFSQPELSRGVRATGTVTLSSYALPGGSHELWSQKGETDLSLWTGSPAADPNSFGIITQSNSFQYLAVHHYEDANGNIVDLPRQIDGGVDNLSFSLSALGYTGKSVQDIFIKNNDELSQIKVFTPAVARQIQDEYQRLLVQ